MEGLYRAGLVAGFLTIAAPAGGAEPGMSERELADRYCGGAGMATEVGMPDGTFADCISPTHAIEVDFTRKWAESLGQALHYALWTHDPLWTFDTATPKRAGIILLCISIRDTCTDHFVRLYRVIEQFDLPVTIWTCDPRTDAALSDCVLIEGGPETGDD